MERDNALASQLREDSGWMLQFATDMRNRLIKPGGNSSALGDDAGSDGRGRQADYSVNGAACLCGETKCNSARMVSCQVVTSLWSQVSPTPLKSNGSVLIAGQRCA